MSATRIATYSVTSGTFEEVLDIATAPDGISSLYQGLPGFERFEVLDLGNDMFASLTTWGSHNQAQAAVTAAAGWVKEKLAGRVELASNAVGDVAYHI